MFEDLRNISEFILHVIQAVALVFIALHRIYYPNDTVAWYPVKWRRCLVAYVGPKKDYNPQDFPEIP